MIENVILCIIRLVLKESDYILCYIFSYFIYIVGFKA